MKGIISVSEGDEESRPFRSVGHWKLWCRKQAWNYFYLTRDADGEGGTHEPTDELQESPAQAGGETEPVAQSANESVKLFERKCCPVVAGKEKKTLTNAQYDVVKALLESGDKGLNKDELDVKSGHGDARRVLKRLADSDSDWASVISFPGTPGKGYRIL